MTLPGKLLYYRKKTGLSQLELAERLDVSRQAVSRWESGAAVPSTENLKFLSGLYGVSVDVLLDDSAEPGEAEVVHPESPEAKEDRHVLSIPRKWVVFLVLAVLLIGIGIGIGVATLREKEETDIVLQGSLNEKTAQSGTEETFELEW